MQPLPGGQRRAAPTSFINFGAGTPGYDTDFDNWAPSVGVAWTPRARRDSPAPSLAERRRSVVRRGYTRAFSREGIADFYHRCKDDPGVTIDAGRSRSLGDVGAAALRYVTAAFGSVVSSDAALPD